jgi:hypothetical protein
MNDEKRKYLEAKRERAERLVKKVGDARGLTRADVLKRITPNPPKAYTVRGPR